MTERLSVLIPADAVADRVSELARRISADYRGRELVVIGVLKGAWIFMADLIRHLEVPVRCDFVGISSYADETESSGVVRITSDLSMNIRGLDVLLVEDIVDTGLTTRYLLENFMTRTPGSLRICALLDKAERRQVPVPLDYTGFTVPNRFVVGYGLDYAQRYRQLPYVAELIFDE